MVVGEVLVKPVGPIVRCSSKLPSVPSQVGPLQVLRNGGACEEAVAGLVNHSCSFRWRRVRVCKFLRLDLGLPPDRLGFLSVILVQVRWCVAALVVPYPIKLVLV